MAGLITNGISLRKEALAVLGNIFQVAVGG